MTEMHRVSIQCDFLERSKGRGWERGTQIDRIEVGQFLAFVCHGRVSRRYRDSRLRRERELLAAQRKRRSGRGGWKLGGTRADLLGATSGARGLRHHCRHQQAPQAVQAKAVSEN